MRSFRDRLAFDAATGEIRDETRRYMLIRPEALMGIFAGLDDDARSAALAALERSVFVRGSNSAEAYRAMGAAEADALIETIRLSAPELGWGLWHFERTEGRLTLTVENSPFAVGFGRSETPVCHAITGMLRAVAGLVFGRPAVSREIACAACGADACRFEAVPAEDGR